MTNIPFEKEEVLKKLEAIVYRGPDNTGYSKVGDITMGHLRLSILDLDARSNQPMVLDELHIVFNGEIYNYLEVKQELIGLGHSFNTTSDTEVLLAGYREWGKELLPKINGMFAFCIYNSESHQIFCARDRIGVKPFYYYWKDGEFEICSQLTPIIPGKKMNKEAISIYLDCRYIPSPYSALEDVFKLPPGCYMEIDLNKRKITTAKYWDLQKVRPRKISYEAAKKEVHDLLKDAVAIRLQSDVPLGSFLSGGIDSALVSSIAAEISKDPINTFSIGFDNPKFDESKIAEQYATIIKSNHKTTICTAEDVMKLIPKLLEVYDEPFADSSALPSLLLNAVTKQYVTVALSGDGGDESFIGYNYFVSLLKINKILKIPYGLRKLISKMGLLKLAGFNSVGFRNAFTIKSINEFIVHIFTGFSSIQKKPVTNWLKHYSGAMDLAKNFVQKAADFNIKLWLENDSNVKVDRASMAYSVEVRSPFLDYRIIELARTLPIKYRYHKGQRKRILRDILKEYIPERVFNQPKKGFGVPLGSWLQNELKEEVHSILTDDFLNFVPNLNVEDFKAKLKYHMEVKPIYEVHIWKVFIFGKWCEKFGFFNFEKSVADELVCE